jgi:MFS family permease
MSSLDNTILASALPTIGREFGDVYSLPWLISIYLLASTAVVPLYGKVSDIHGRRFTLRIALVIYMAGSLLCALAPNMTTLILGRVLHGLGGGGLASMGAVVLGDVVAPKERGRYYSYFAVVYTGIGFVLRLMTAPEPLIPIDVLLNPTVCCCVVAHAFGWGSIVGLNIFLPMYLQNVVGLSATNAGLSLMVLMIALNVSAGLSGYMLGRMVRYKLLPLASLVVAIAATAVVALFGAIVAGSASVTGAPAPGELGGALSHDAALAAEAFRRVFFTAAGTLTVALIAVLLMEAKPLQTGVEAETK